MAATVPEQGQVVQVRHRRYVVTTIQQRLLPQPLLATPIPLQHVVTLQALEEDALGEELQVVWELEVGAQVVNQRALPAPLMALMPRNALMPSWMRCAGERLQVPIRVRSKLPFAVGLPLKIISLIRWCVRFRCRVPIC